MKPGFFCAYAARSSSGRRTRLPVRKFGVKALDDS
jgi:hypothetical protein